MFNEEFSVVADPAPGSSDHTEIPHPAVVHAMVDYGVGIITLSRPEKYNAVNSQLLAALEESLSQLLSDDAVRVIVLTGAGKAFSAGADIHQYANSDAATFKEFTVRCNALCHRLATASKPVIAAVNGVALGGGFEIALSCDLVVAGETATFGLPELSLGLIPGWGGTQRLTEYVGVNRAKEILFTGRRLTAGEAYDLGIVNQVHSPENLRAAASDLARSIANQGSLALAAAKQAINHASSSRDQFSAGFAIEQANLQELFHTGDAREGVRAFVEKRVARFSGQ